MAENRKIIRLDSLSEVRSVDLGVANASIYPSTLIHLYVRLNIEHDVEYATTKTTAGLYLNAVAEAAMIVQRVARRPEFDGLLLEPQGSTIHAALPHQGNYPESAIAFASAIHYFFNQRLTGKHSCVNGWRMTADAGRTLVVSRPGVHDDHSLVSIGNAANRPAKHLYQQLSIPEEDRHLTRYSLGYRDPDTGRWFHQDLNKISGRITASRVEEDVLEGLDYEVRLLRSGSSGPEPITASAFPVSPGGSPGSPTAERPAQHFGWVIRADLDGFTARVEQCFDQDHRLNELARWLVRLMDCSAEYVHEHEDEMVQLPWAGDNFTAAVVFSSKQEYDRARPERLVDDTLDFADATREDCDGTGWAYGVCGGEVHGNAVGNLFVGSVEFDSIRFLIGAGAGFSRSLQAFSDIKPAAGRIDILKEDKDQLVDRYRGEFTDAKRADGGTSTLFKEAKISRLDRIRDDAVTADRSVSVQTATGTTGTVALRPYANPAL